jgi:DNA-binding response OmpR family regulator
MIYHTLPLNTPAMVIEPDEKQASDIAVALRCAGYSPQVMGTGQEALEKLPIFLPALVVLDLQLPDVPGLDVIRYIRSEPSLSKTWVIVATSEPALTVDLHDAAELALIKPITFTQMRDLAMRFRRSTG